MIPPQQSGTGTPRTDAAKCTYYGRDVAGERLTTVEAVPVEAALQLETELTAAKDAERIARAEVEFATDEARKLREQMDGNIEDFLNEKACCNGDECGCGGVTRLQQYVQEEAGAAMGSLRAQLQAKEQELAEAKRQLSFIDNATLPSLRHERNWLKEQLAARDARSLSTIAGLREKLIQVRDGIVIKDGWGMIRVAPIEMVKAGTIPVDADRDSFELMYSFITNALAQVPPPKPDVP